MTALRILGDRLARGSIREHYWAAGKLAGELARLGNRERRAFRRVTAADLGRYMRGVEPIAGETLQRLDAAVRWLTRAQDATPDGGVSYGFFPTGAAGGWDVSYPETTGYIISTLLNFGLITGREDVGARAVRMAEWEAEVQMPCGAAQGGKRYPSERQSPAAFNTGMVLDGWCSVCAQAPRPDLLAAARRAADWLVGDLNDDGHFRTNGEFVSADTIKTYTCLCAWAMYRFGDLVDDDRYRRAAVLAIEAAIRKQRLNGWIEDNCLDRHDAPLTHTIGYSLQGMVEVGVLARRDAFVAAAKLTVDALIPRIRDDGYLPGRFDANWVPMAFSSCLTGSAQVAIVSYRLAEQLGDARYARAGDRLVNFLKAVQTVDSGDADIDGALAGSFPIYGSYMRGGYPNWATKYLADALMLQAAAHGT